MELLYIFLKFGKLGQNYLEALKFLCWYIGTFWIHQSLPKLDLERKEIGRFFIFQMVMKNFHSISSAPDINLHYAIGIFIYNFI